MPVGLSEPGKLLPVKGVKLASTACGIKANAKDDLVLMLFEAGSCCAATFTKNAFCAAPVLLARQHLNQSEPRAFLINSGNANAGTGQQGIQDATQSCEWVANTLKLKPSQVLPFSTGIIGENLPMDKLQEGIKSLDGQLASSNWLAAAKGIMTTDTVAKAHSEQFELDGETITITGIAKGSGMIRPDMATMLCFIATDATISSSLLQASLNSAVENSFNAITVDGDTSTNDACMLVASCKSSTSIEKGSENARLFNQAIERVCTLLAQSIVRDGEGATKFVTIQVADASTVQEARTVAYTIAHSPLVKTALFASDPNWGRILAAVGRSGIEDFDINRVKIFLDDVCIVTDGGRSESYTEAQGQAVMNQPEITIGVELGRGNAVATVWTTDLSHDYVTINAEYRT